MSRVGKKPIVIPDGVEITVNNSQITVKGPLGVNNETLLDGIKIEINDKILTVVKEGDEFDKKLSAKHGLIRALLSNLVTGVSQGFKKDLEIVGVGYRAIQKSENIEFSLGYSHPILFSPPEGIKLTVLETTKVQVSGIDRQKVGQVAANIRKLRPPEPYKGKGIKYKDETIRRKAGKAGKV